MQFKVLPVGFAAYACFASSVNAGPIGSSHAASRNTKVIPREPQLVTTDILPPIFIDVRPDGMIQVTEGHSLSDTQPAHAHPTHTRPARTHSSHKHPPHRHPSHVTKTTNSTEDRKSTLEARGKVPQEPTFFDKRPERYISPILPYTEVTNRTARDESLSQLWNVVPEFNKLDNGNYYGSEKWLLLQKFNVGTLSEKDDNHEDINFAARVFGTTPETIKWFSYQMATSQSLREDEHWPEYAMYEPTDHFNWIRKAHSILSRMTKVEQRAMNDAIDTIGKQSTEDLYKIYSTFEVHPNMLPEHKLQATEFFQMIKLKFPPLDQDNSVKSSRPPMQLHDWYSKQHPRHAAFRPIDALARHAIPAIDSDHSDWTSQTAFKIAHLSPTAQRDLRDHVRLIPKSYAPTPANLKDFYDTIDVDWQGRDSDAKKAEVASILCVRELVFAGMPKRKPMSRGWDWGKVAQQPAMVNSCTEEQREERLKDLFFIERWDADHQDPQTASSSASSSSPIEARSMAAEEEGEEKHQGKLSELGERIGGKLDKFAELLKPGENKLKEHLKEWENQLDHDLHRYQDSLNKFEKAIEPLVHDVGTLGQQAWEKLKDELLIPL